jgi:hypothetical protein
MIVKVVLTYNDIIIPNPMQFLTVVNAEFF